MWAVAHGVKDGGDDVARHARPASAAWRIVRKGCEAAAMKSPAPEAHRRRADAEPIGDHAGWQTVGGEEDDAAADDEAMSRSGRAGPARKLHALSVCDGYARQRGGAAVGRQFAKRRGRRCVVCGAAVAIILPHADFGLPEKTISRPVRPHRVQRATRSLFRRTPAWFYTDDIAIGMMLKDLPCLRIAARCAAMRGESVTDALV